MSRFVVTTSANDVSRSVIWDSRSPLPIGHPFQWVIEKTDSGVRIRKLSSELGKIAKGTAKEIPLKSLIDDEKEVALPSEDGSTLHFKIRPVASVLPAFENTQGNYLTAYVCTGDWVTHSIPIESTFNGVAGTKKIFKIKKSGNVVDLNVLSDGLTFNGKPIAAGQTTQLLVDQFVKSTFKMGRLTWRFSLAESPAEITSRGLKARADEETQFFNKAGVGTAIGFCLFLAIAWIWPKPDPTKEELIPPQFAQIVLQHQPKVDLPKKPESSARENTNPDVPKKVQDAAVVQAFRAQALKNAVSGLLKGGMTKLLSQTDLVQGKSTEAAKHIFDAKSQALLAATPQGKVPEKNVQVAAMGGQAGGNSAGYTKGERAVVKGQGEGFISTDVGGTTVEEGLTKDEVGAVIHKHMSEVRYCYESAMIRSPALEGKLIINFTIAGSGAVKTSEVKSSTLPDPRLDDCVLRRLASWKFPQPKGGVEVAVSYPFIFKTLGR